MLVASELKHSRSKTFMTKSAYNHLEHVLITSENVRMGIQQMDQTKLELKAYLRNFEGRDTSFFEETKKILTEEFKKSHENFLKDLAAQKKENDVLIRQIVDMKKQQSELKNMVASLTKKCVTLETELGKYPK